MNRLLSLLLTCTMVLTLCACGESAGHNIAPLPDETPTPIVDTTPPPADNNEAEEKTPPPVSDTEEELTMPEEEETPEEYVRTIDPYGKMVALTFDDGPHETYSDMILDVLEEYHSVATFFEVGRNARAYPEVLSRMAELGCEIASHSNVHHDLTTLSRNALLTDLGYADAAIAKAAGTAPTLIRPPYGAVNKAVKNETGRAIITWTIDTQDWLHRDSQKLIEYFQSLPSLDGEVVLMHSIHGSTAEAMKTVVPWLIEQGYQLVTVSELMAYYYGVLLEPNVFYNQTWFARHERTEYPLELPAEPMQTQIPEYTIVPVVPIVETPETPETSPETPSDTPEVPPESPETPETPPESPPENSGSETPPEDIPPEQDDTATEPEAPSDEPENSGEAEENPGKNNGDAAPPPEERPPSEPELPPESPPPFEDRPPQNDGEVPTA